jgi:hypothetical protein
MHMHISLLIHITLRTELFGPIKWKKVKVVVFTPNFSHWEKVERVVRAKGCISFYF